MIVYCCADLIFATKIQSTCDALGLTARPARNEAMLQKRLDRVEDGKPNGAVAAVLIDLDRGDEALPLIAQCKQHAVPPTVVAWGPHVLVDLLKQAKKAGADEVMTRGSFTANLPALLQQLSSAAAETKGDA
ncbi:hypothetical protein OT109_01095 [Phycisphaeraceae bacterium D3-23]